MIFPNDQAIVDYIKANQTVPDKIKKARDYSAMLCALVEGEKYVEFLISRIEKLENAERAQVRKQYAQTIEDFFARLFLPIENVFTATGGTKNYTNGKAKLSEPQLAQLLSFVSNIRDGKSIEIYIQEQWMDLYHTDPAGILKMAYTTKPEGGLKSIYPVYYGINTIRTYIDKGQLVENILFEPVEQPDGSKIWTVIDDKYQYSFLQRGEDIQRNPDASKTFQHPFGIVPVIINSNILDKNGARLSPLHRVISKIREYARDQSIKTVFKFLQGFPMTYHMDILCIKCNGSKKDGLNDCSACGGTGWFNGKGDVTTDFVTQAPDADTPAIDPKLIAGFIQPDLETWRMFNEELEWEERKIIMTYWGLEPQQEQTVAKTATEIILNKQPQINKLTRYSFTAEWIEYTMTELIARAITNNPQLGTVSLIVYGNHFILEGIDEILTKYYTAKQHDAPDTIKDSIFDEILTVKFKYDLEYLARMKKKAGCEYYLHYTATEVNSLRGAVETAKKMFFQSWWLTLSDEDLLKDLPQLIEMRDTAFTEYWAKNKPEPPTPTVVVPPEQESAE